MWPALISGAAGLLGNWFSSTTSAQNTQLQQQNQLAMFGDTMRFNQAEATTNREFQAGQAQRQMDFQERMAGTAFQRARQDMEAAGLNPILAAGAQSATPSGAAGSGAQASVSTPTAPTPQTRHPLEGLGRVINDAVNTAIGVTTQEKMVDEIANLKTTRSKMEAETATEKERPGYVREETETERKRQRLLHREAQKVAEQVPGEAAKARQEEVEAERQEKINRELYQNEITKKLIQGGILGKSASDMIGPIRDVFESVAGSALRKRGQDLLKEEMKKKYGTRTSTEKTTLPNGRVIRKDGEVWYND